MAESTPLLSAASDSGTALTLRSPTSASETHFGSTINAHAGDASGQGGQAAASSYAAPAPAAAAKIRNQLGLVNGVVVPCA